MPEPQTNSRPTKDQDRESIKYAKQSLVRGEPENKITADIINNNYPDDAARGHDYARYVLAEARFELDRERPIHTEQSNMKNGNNTRNSHSDQYQRDWAYAIRSLEKGDAPEKVIGDMAAFRKDLSDPHKYAETTVGNAQQHLQVRSELSNAAKGRRAHVPDYTALDNAVQQASHLELARQLYEDGGYRQTVTESLQRDRQLEQPEAANIAKEAEARSFAERDLNYAIRARERGDGDERIIPKIAEYRQGQVENPHDYARTILEAADKTRQLEREHAGMTSSQEQIATAQDQYRRDLQFAVFQREHRTPDELQLAISERRPERAKDASSFRMHGLSDHSYAVAVSEQAHRIREVTDRGRSLEDTLDVAEREFGRHLQEALRQREIGRTANQVVKDISTHNSVDTYYARAVVNQADSIREQQRAMSIRPEMAIIAADHITRGSPNLTQVRAIADVER